MKHLKNLPARALIAALLATGWLTVTAAPAMAADAAPAAAPPAAAADPVDPALAAAIAADEDPEMRRRVIGEENPKTNDFPTLARVEYVFQCMAENKGPRHEMIYKCSCAADALARKVSYARWEILSTINSGRFMAGERGSYVRERKDTMSMVKTYSAVQKEVRSDCFIDEPQS